MNSALQIGPPDASEYAPYHGQYVGKVAGHDILETLTRDGQAAEKFYAAVGEEKADHRYAPDKWSIREVLGHVIDTERIFAYRALRISRGDETPLAGFDQEPYVQNGPYAKCRMADLVQEFSCVRRGTELLLRNLDEAAWMRKGTASEKQVTVRALSYLIAGHELHHRKIVQERYLAT